MIGGETKFVLDQQQGFQKWKEKAEEQVCIKLFGVISISIKSARSDGNPHKEREREGCMGRGGG